MRRTSSIAARAAALLFLAFLLLPVVALLAGGLPSLGEGLRDPLVAPALRLTALTTTVSLAVVAVFGTSLAWSAARGRGGWARLAELVAQIPIVIPPAAAGVALLLAFGRRSPVGAVLERAGLSVPFTTAAVVVAEVFVSAPFFVQAAIAAFRRVDEEVLLVARTLGASPARTFFRVALPLSFPGLVSGAAMSWARAVGEFGATLMFAGSLAGRTQTMPLAIYAALETDVGAAQALSVVLVLFAFALMAVVRGAAPLFERRAQEGRP